MISAALICGASGSMRSEEGDSKKGKATNEGMSLSPMYSEFQDLKIMLSRWNVLRGRIALATASQGISSATNFAFTIFLVRWLEKEEFGLYGLGFAALLTLAGMLASVITLQFTVNRADVAVSERPLFTLHYLIAMTLAGCGVILLSASLADLGEYAFGLDPGTSRIIVPVGIATSIFSLRDLTTRVAHSQRDESLVLKASAITAGAIATMVGVLMSGAVPPSSETALYAYTIGQLAAAFFVVAKLRLPWRGLNLGRLKVVFAQSWTAGRWSLLGSIATNIRTQAHNFVVAPLLGMSALADINAARVLVTPAILLIPPVSQIVLPRLSELRGESSSEFVSLLKTFTVLLSFIACGYSALILGFLPIILPSVLGSAYSGSETIVLAWCVFTIILATRVGAVLAAEALKQFIPLLLIGVLGAALGIMLTYGSSLYLGKAGAVYAIAAGELIIAILVSWLVGAKLGLLRT